MNQVEVDGNFCISLTLFYRKYDYLQEILGIMKHVITFFQSHRTIIQTTRH